MKTQNRPSEIEYPLRRFIDLGLVSGSLRYAHIEIMPWLPTVLKGRLLTYTNVEQRQNRLTLL